MKNNIKVIILAGGEGKRMLSKIPKTLHTIAGKPIIQYILKTIENLKIKNISIIYGNNGKLIKSYLSKNKLINWVLQEHPLGTGHAIKLLESEFYENTNILILYGDVPFISAKTIKKLYFKKPKNGIAIITAIVNNPNGYGRIIRKNGKIEKIVEDIDANIEQKKINEINTGIFIANAFDIKNWVKKINKLNYSKEYYITEIINLAYKENKDIISISPNNLLEIRGINNCLELSNLEHDYQIFQAKKLMLKGLILLDPNRFDLRGKLQHGKNVIIDINVIIEGNVIIGDNVKIGSGSIIKDSIIGNNCVINPYSIIDTTIIDDKCIIGPFSRLRPKNILQKKSSIGNFVEIKNIKLGKNSKINHFSYIGDTEIGSNTNCGAGTVTCNYDGNKKYKTKIGNNVFIGSNTQIIAPVSITDNAYIAAGTTIMKNIFQPGLVYNKKKQLQKNYWKNKKKK